MEFAPKVFDPNVLLFVRVELNRAGLLKADLSELVKDPNDLTSSLLSLLAPNTKVLAGAAGVAGVMDPPNDGVDDGVVATVGIVFDGSGVSTPNTSLGGVTSGFFAENPPKLKPPATGFVILDPPKEKSFVFFTSFVIVGRTSPNFKEPGALLVSEIVSTTVVGLNAKEANPDPKLVVGGVIFATSSTLASLSLSSVLLTIDVVGLNVKKAVAVAEDTVEGALKLKLGILGIVDVIEVGIGIIDGVGG